MQLFQRPERKARLNRKVIQARHKLHVFYTIDQSFKAPVQFTSSKRCTQTVMNTRTKGEVFARLVALQIELCRSVEFTLIQIGSAIANIHHRACRYPGTGKFEVARGHPKQSLYRAFKPQYFLYEGTHVSLRVTLELLPGERIFDKQLHPITNGVGCGFGPPNKGVSHHFRVQFVVVQWPAPFGNDPVHHL